MMHRKKPALCLAVSVAAHVVCLYAFVLIGRLDLGVPVAVPSVVRVDLKELPPQQALLSTGEDDDGDGEPSAEAAAAPFAAGQSPVPVAEQGGITGLEPAALSLPEKEPARSLKEVDPLLAPPATAETKPLHDSPSFELLQPVRLSGEFLASESETLSYRIYLLGMPVGTARLEARRDRGEVRISLRVTSDAVISSFYPVDDLVETRHINGNFIITRIRQKEGSFLGDRGFTIFLRDKHVFWIDRLSRRSVTESIPTSDVVDLLSGLYYLRNRQLVVGVSETLHIYDSDSYAAVPVDVLRRETVRLSGLRTVESLLVVPQLKTGGIFRRTGDIQIWLSDDEFRVPVKVETTIPIGRVTAELVDAEAKR